MISYPFQEPPLQGVVTGLLPTARWDAAADASWPGGLPLRSQSLKMQEVWTAEVGSWCFTMIMLCFSPCHNGSNFHFRDLKNSHVAWGISDSSSERSLCVRCTELGHEGAINTLGKAAVRNMHTKTQHIIVPVLVGGKRAWNCSVGHRWFWTTPAESSDL